DPAVECGLREEREILLRDRVASVRDRDPHLRREHLPVEVDVEATAARRDSNQGRPARVRAHAHRLRERLGRPDGAEREVDASGQVAHLPDRVARRRVDDIGGAEHTRQLELLGGDVDGDDARGAGELRALHDGEADAAAADDRDRGAHLHRRRPKRRAGAGGEAAREQRSLLHRQLAGNLHRARLVHDRHVPHGARHATTTRSPGATNVTSGPTSSTTPAPSWPSRIGSSIPHPPVSTTWTSVWQSPHASTRTSTSRPTGPSSVISSTAGRTPASEKTTPRVTRRRA